MLPSQLGSLILGFVEGEGEGSELSMFYKTRNNAETTIASAYTADDGEIIVADGDVFGSNYPILISTFLADGTPKGVYECSDRIEDTLTISFISGTDANLSVGDLVKMCWTVEHVNQITDAIQGILGTNTFSDNNSFATGNNTSAAGESSFACGDGCIASTYYSHAEGYGTLAGAIPKDCTISGTTVTFPNIDVSGFFYVSDYPIALTSLTGGSGPTTALGIVTDVVFDDPDTIVTLEASVTSHTAGKANMTDFVDAVHAEGYLTIASHLGAHAEGTNTIASGNASHAEGRQTTASGWAAHSEGHMTLASGDYSHAEGYYTEASDSFSHAEGENSIALGFASHAEGSYSKASLRNQHSHASGIFATVGDAQYSRLTLRKISTNATPVELLIGNSDYAIIRTNITVGFTVNIVAKSGTNCARFVRSGLIANNSNTVALVGSVQTIGTDINTPNWSVAITADDTNKSLKIEVTGGAATNIHWHAVLEWNEVG